MSLLCRSCDQPPGSLHLDSCPQKRSFMGGIVSVFECYQTDFVKPSDRRKEDKSQ